MTASTSGEKERRAALVALLASFAERYPEIPRRREDVQTPAALTRAYVELVLAWGLAKLGDDELASALRERALGALDRGDVVHAYLAGALVARIDHATAGLPPDAALPSPLGRGLAGLARLDRYKVDMARKHLRILEPVEVVDPLVKIRPGEDGLGPELTECRWLEADALAVVLERLTARARTESAWGETHRRLMRGVLCFLPHVDEEKAGALLERIMEAIDYAQLPLVLLELQLAARLRRADLVERAFDRVEAVFKERRGLDTLATGNVLGAALPAVRGIGHRHRVRQVLARAPDVGTRDDTFALVLRALCAAAHAYLGDPAGRAEEWWTAEHPGVEGLVTWSRVSDAERAQVLRDVDHVLARGRPSVLGDVRVLETQRERRASLARAETMLADAAQSLEAALARALPDEPLVRSLPETARAMALAASFLPLAEALATFERLFERVRLVSDRYNVNTHLSVSVVGYLDALVTAIVAAA